MILDGFGSSFCVCYIQLWLLVANLLIGFLPQDLEHEAGH